MEPFRVLVDHEMHHFSIMELSRFSTKSSCFFIKHYLKIHLRLCLRREINATALD